MKNGSVRKILLVAAGSVFLFSGIMVSKYHLELQAGAEYAENLAQMVVIPYAQQPEKQIREESISETTAPVPIHTAGESLDEFVGAALKQASEETVPEPSDDAPAQPAEEALAAPAGDPSARAAEETADVFADSASGNTPNGDISDYSGDTPTQSVKETIVAPSGVAPAHTAKGSIRKSSRVAPIQVDFDALCAKNQDVVAWIYCPDTPINYPVVQGEDNEYYMHRLLDGSKSYPGTLFMDFRNANDFSDWNSVIYGHNMRNDTMFGTLQDYTMKSYFKAHPEIFLLTPECNYVMDVLTGFVTSDHSEVYNSLHPDDTEKESLLKSWLDDSGLVPEDFLSPEIRLVTLSTCSYAYKDARYVLIGALAELAG